MKRFTLAFVLGAGCGNDLPLAGNCPAPAGGGDVIVEAVPLATGIFFDDLAYSSQLGAVVAAPEGADTLYLIDPVTMAVTEHVVGQDLASADASADLVLAASRPTRAILIIDPVSGDVLASTTSTGGPDYVRVTPDGNELWITHPGGNAIEVRSIVRGAPPRLDPLATIAIPGGPEGLHFAGARAYTQTGGRLIAIDVAEHRVVADWDTGCNGSHGFPMADDLRALAIAGCNVDGGAAVVDTGSGDVRSGFEAGGGEAVLAYSTVLGHFYLRGDPGPTLSILGVCDDGAMALLGTAEIPNYGHAMAADDAGHVWIADPDHGGLVRVTDPFPAMP